MVKFAKLIFITVFAFISFQCANQLPPGGGEIDREPPEIVSIYPENQTTNFSEKYFEIEFSEYVEKRSFKDAIFISPALQHGIETDWSGKSVRVNFLDTLRENTTYTVTIGTDVVDYNNKNRLAQAVAFAFSTGDKIANGTLSGTVFSDKPSGVFLFAYLNPPDTLNISSDKPDYVSQAGKEGQFSFTGLNYGRYRVFAVKDEFKDLLFQPEQDMAGVPAKDFVLTPKDTGYSQLNFVLSKIDTTGPRLISAVMTDAKHILVTLSEEVPVDSFSVTNFELADTISLIKYAPDYLYKGRAKEKEFILGLKDLVISDSAGYFLFARNFADAKGNLTGTDSISIFGNTKPDTTVPSIIKVVPSYNSAEVTYEDTKIYFGFDDAVSLDRLFKTVRFTDSARVPVKFEAVKSDDASFAVKVSGSLKPMTDYVISMDLNEAVDAGGNFSDSIYIYKFRTKSDLSITGLYGSLLNHKADKQPVIVMENSEKQGVRYLAKPGPKGNFEFRKVEPGKYQIMFFYDADGNGEYSPGKLDPFQYSEEFFYFKDVISLAPRWAVTDFIFDIEKDCK